MFESDDFDQILSQLDLPEPSNDNLSTKAEKENTECDPNSDTFINFHNNLCTQKLSNGVKENKIETNFVKESKIEINVVKVNNIETNVKENIIETSDKSMQIGSLGNIHTSPKYSKRKLIDSYFNHKSKRKFPGPAGLLNGTFGDSTEVDDICHVELLSQDIDYTDSYLRKGIFESPLWARLLQDTRDIRNVDSIKNIKQQALNGNLRHQKAESIRAYVERVDRTAKDPLIELRDVTDDIKCTLHRDAWVAFSPYIVSECCGLVLCSPTVLTTGSAFKKHYLNITLSNIQALYSSAVIKQEDETFPEGFVKIYEEDYTIIRNQKQNTGNSNYAIQFEDANLLDGLDGAFSDVFS